jgi:hypothetical protein
VRRRLQQVASADTWWPGQAGEHGPIGFNVPSDGSGIELAWVVGNCDVDASIEVAPAVDHHALSVCLIYAGRDGYDIYRWLLSQHK